MKTKVASALLLFLAAALAAAQSPSQTPAQPIAQPAEEKAKQQATIGGQVLNKVTRAPDTPLVVRFSKVMRGLVLKMLPRGVIAARVLDDEGEPVSGVAMQVLQ